MEILAESRYYVIGTQTRANAITPLADHSDQTSDTVPAIVSARAPLISTRG